MRSFVSRRRVIIGFAAAAIASLAPWRRVAFGPDPLSILRDALAQRCENLAVLARLRRGCVNESICLRPLATGPMDVAARYASAAAAGADFADWLGAETKADFEAGRVVRVEGWVISETEHALFSIDAPLESS
jgi:hypothetical protein